MKGIAFLAKFVTFRNDFPARGLKQFGVILHKHKSTFRNDFPARGLKHNEAIAIGNSRFTKEMGLKPHAYKTALIFLILSANNSSIIE